MRMVMKSGAGSCVICGTRSVLTPMEVTAVNKQLLAGESIRAVAQRWNVSESATRRHKINHAVRPVVMDVRLDEDRSAFETVDALMAAFDDADLIRRQALVKGNHAVALRAMGTQQRLAKTLWDSLGIDAGTERLRSKEFDAMNVAVRAVCDEHPVFAKALAKRIDLPEVRDALLGLYNRATTAKKASAAA